MLTRSSARRWLLAILLAGGASRLILALLGGQGMHGDEFRYFRGAYVMHSALEGDFAAWKSFPTAVAHPGFIYLAAAIAPVHEALAKLTGQGGPDFGFTMYSTAYLGTSLLGLFSTLNLWLLYRVARRAGAGREEALWGAFLAGASLTLTAYARHLLPYDASLTFFLLAYLAGQRATVTRAALAGAAAAFGYTVYNGHWYLVPLVAAALAWRHRGAPVRFQLLGAAAAGAALGGAIGYAPAILIGPGTTLKDVSQFAQSIRDGDFAEGWSLPWEFLWHAEGLFGIAVLLLALGAAFRRGAAAHVRGWLLGAVTIYALLVLFSVGLEKFVVYARTVRPIVPLLCLAAGAGVAALVAGDRLRRISAVAIILIAAALNLAPLFPQVYPVELDRKVHAQIGVPHDYLTFLNSWDKPPHAPVSRPDLVLVNTYPLFGFDSHRDYPPGEVLLDVPHPLALPFYRFDGHTRAQRQLLADHEPRMKLIRLPKPRAVINAP
jgi:hypothetical protein